VHTATFWKKIVISYLPIRQTGLIEADWPPESSIDTLMLLCNTANGDCPLIWLDGPSKPFESITATPMTRVSNESSLCRTAWWIVSRGDIWGPFDYQWSTDLRGLELTFWGEKFGEICSADEFFADLAPFHIPISVCRVSAIVAGSLAVSVSIVETLDARAARLTRTLNDFGFGRFTVRIDDRPPARPQPRSQDSSSDRRS